MFQTKNFKKSVSIILPAYNEEHNISFFLKKLLKYLNNLDYEIIIVNDFSKDKTLKISKLFSKKNKKIKIINNKKNLGFGGSFKEGIKISKKDYIIVLPGDGETNPKMIFNEFKKLNNPNETLVFFWKNQKRKFLRKFLSFLYTKIINFSFNISSKYVNGPVFYKATELKKLNFSSKSFFFFAEILSQLQLNKKFIYKEVCIQYLKPRRYRSEALRYELVISLIKEYLIFMYRFYFKKRKS